MGSTTFTQIAKGKTATDAYRAAVERAQYEEGHDVYNGTISTTCEFSMIDVDKFAERAVRYWSSQRTDAIMPTQRKLMRDLERDAKRPTMTYEQRDAVGERLFVWLGANNDDVKRACSQRRARATKQLADLKLKGKKRTLAVCDYLEQIGYVEKRSAMCAQIRTGEYAFVVCAAM